MQDTFIHAPGNPPRNAILLTHLVTGASRHTYIHESCPNSLDLAIKVQSHGGTVVSSNRDAHIILADYAAPDFYSKTFNMLNTKAVKAGEKVIVSYDWLDASIAANQMLEPAVFKPDPPKRKYKKRESTKQPSGELADNAEDGGEEQKQQPVASTSAAPTPAAPIAASQVRKARQTFDADDDARLVRFFAKFGDLSDGQPRSVTAVARLLAAQYPEHSWESWRERYKRAQGGPSHWTPLIEDMRRQMRQEGYVSPEEVDVDFSKAQRPPSKQKDPAPQQEPENAVVQLAHSQFSQTDMHSTNDIEINPASSAMQSQSHDGNSLQFPPCSSSFVPSSFPLHGPPYAEYMFCPPQANIDPQLQNIQDEPIPKRRRLEEHN